MVHALWFIGAILMSLQTNVCEGAKILGIFPFQAKSHAIINTALMRELANRGHHVTVLTLHPQKETLENYTDIVLKSSMLDFVPPENKNMFNRQKGGLLKMINGLFTLNQAVCDHQLQEEDVQKLIHAKDLHFDLVIIEAFFNECFLGFVHKFKAPLVQICTFGAFDYMGDWVGNPNPYSYIPNPLLKFRSKMNFSERLINTIMGMFFKLLRTYYYLPGQDAIMRKHFNDYSDLPSISEIEYTTSLLLVNHHFSISYPKPLMPNIVQVGGLHVKPPKQLPPDLKAYLDDATDGVIYFSMGSNLKSSDMPETMRNAFVEAFSTLKQRVLWKWESDNLPGKPNNVQMGKWLPQSDILAHPNIRLFMTHGGLLGTQEAINRGVPVVGIPVFGDQELNMAWAQSAGFGVLLNFNNITTESVKWALKEVLDNPRYRDNAQRLSRIYRDQPLTPLQQAVFWTEYVIRHKGAPHMRSAVLDLAWYQYFLLDVIAVLILAIVAIVIVFYLTLRVLLKIVSGLRGSNKIAKNRQKKRN